ncbi:MAG: DUF935 domain-containing protein [Crocinitomicaceae bacterium]|jgi:phage gp29-like protein|nr:DUF935 domain-containing protein [Crocinitomicaceae bacterium]
MEQRKNQLFSQVQKTSIFRSRKDIQQWRSAIQQAENVNNPKRILLYNIYDEILLDGHLTAELNKRILNLAGAEFYLYDKNGKHNEDVALIFDRSWFQSFIEYALESKFWGHSLLEITLGVENIIEQLKLIPRRHVRPETGLFVQQQNDDKGIIYRDNKQYENWLIEIGKWDDLGLLNKIVPYVLFKRFAMSAWSEYCEIFGMPVRVAKTNTKDDKSLNRLDQMMIDMASSSYAVIDKDEELDFLESAGGKGEVYDKLIDRCNSEISKLINGSVIGEASQGGSRSKEEVGLQIQQQITAADMQWLQSLVNEILIPKMIQWGLMPVGFTFEFEKQKDLNTIWKYVSGVLEHYDIEPEYIQDTFGIPVKPKANTTPITNAKGSAGFFS